LSTEGKECRDGSPAAHVPQLQDGVRQRLGGRAGLPALQGDGGVAQRRIGQREQLRSIRRTIWSEGQLLIASDDGTENDKVTRWL
jgi:hypothetical protein